MPNIRLVIEYDGSRFHGWQMQPGLRTVQGELQRVLEMVLRQEIRCVHASGRTDAGVHARGQVVNFQVAGNADLGVLKHSVSSLLRGELAVLAADIVPDDFQAQHHARSKQYRYTILNRPVPPVLDRGRAWHVSATLDIPRMQREAELLIGRHDFKSFQGRDCGAESTVKEILESEITAAGEYIYYRVIGRGFLKQMVRIIAGTLVDFGRGHMTQPSMTAVLCERRRAAAGQTAPPWGLCLEWVQYDEAALSKLGVTRAT